MSRENLRKSERSLDTNLPQTISSPLVSKDIMPEIEVMIGQLEGNLR